MTVCIAAMCTTPEGPMVVGASDRMLTAGDTESEPKQTKLGALTPANNVVALVSGDASTQIDIMNTTTLEIAAMGRPLLCVDEVVGIYRRHFAALRTRLSEQMLLAPLGLTLKTFHQRQTDLPDGLLTRLIHELRDFEVEAETIITGVDELGAHIYVVTNPGIASCQNSVGYAAIGSGGRHASSQFMFERYISGWPLERALFITYAAKRRSEVAPFVGKETDVFAITPMPQPRFTQTVDGDAVLATMRDVYDRSQEKYAKIDDAAYIEIQQFMNDFLTKQAQPPQPPSPDQSPNPEKTS